MEMKEKRLEVLDTTLRDGEQSAGVSFKVSEKLEIAKALDLMGVDIIEAGIPIMGKEEKETIQKILDLDLKAEILTWNRMRMEDIIASKEAGAKNVHVSVPSSDIHIQKKLGIDRKTLLEKMSEVIDLSQKYDMNISIGAEDASRADQNFLVELYAQAIQRGAFRIRYADTVSVLSPFTAKERIENLIDGICKKLNWDEKDFHRKVMIDFHGHNDLGLGTANALGAYNGGAHAISCSVNGLGERAGNTALEEIVLSLELMEDVTCNIDLQQIMKVSKMVEIYSGRILQASKPIVGDMVFSHEAGIHVDGLLKDRKIYEFLSPESLGRRHSIVKGKHSGKSYEKYINVHPK